MLTLVGFEPGTSGLLPCMAELDWLKSPGKRKVPGSNPTEGNNIFFMSEKLLIFSTVQWYLKCKIHILMDLKIQDFNPTFWSLEMIWAFDQTHERISKSQCKRFSPSFEEEGEKATNIGFLPRYDLAWWSQSEAWLESLVFLSPK